jgi:hypothetical protein
MPKASPSNNNDMAKPAGTKPIQWVDSKGLRYPFPISNDGSSDDELEVLEYEAAGTVVKNFLHAGAKAHTIAVTIPQSEIEFIKNIVKTCPEYNDNHFTWPFEGTTAKFTSKDNLLDRGDQAH